MEGNRKYAISKKKQKNNKLPTINRTLSCCKSCTFKQREVITGTQHIFDFIGYQYDLREGKVRPTLERWQTLYLKIQKFLTDPSCRVLKEANPNQSMRKSRPFLQSGATVFR